MNEIYRQLALEAEFTEYDFIMRWDNFQKFAELVAVESKTEIEQLKKEVEELQQLLKSK